MKLRPGIYESEYGNAVAWDGRRAVDLDLMEEVPADVILNENFVRALEDEDRALMGGIRSVFAGGYRGC